MTPRHYVLTLTGAAQQLSDVLPTAEINPDTPGVPIGGADRASRKFNSWDVLYLQAGAANAAAIFVGGDNTVSSTVYGIRIPAAAAGVPGAPLVFGPLVNAKLKFEQFWVFGTTNEKLHVYAIEQ